MLSERQNDIFQRNLKRLKGFDVGDIIGLKVANVDRSNTAPSILPCKIIDIVAGNTTDCMKYRLSTATGVISGTFMASDFVDLNGTLSATLRQIDLSTLPSISIIQACQEYTQFRSTTACKCITSCDTARCPCRKRSVQCSTKCHRGKQTSCKNQS